MCNIYFLIFLPLISGTYFRRHHISHNTQPQLFKEDWKDGKIEAPLINEVNVIRISEQHRGPVNLSNETTHLPNENFDSFRVDNLKVKVSETETKLTSSPTRSQNPTLRLSHFKNQMAKRFEDNFTDVQDENSEKKLKMPQSESNDNDIRLKSFLSTSYVPKPIDRNVNDAHFKNFELPSLRSELQLRGKGTPENSTEHLLRILIRKWDANFLNSDLVPMMDTVLQSSSTTPTDRPDGFTADMDKTEANIRNTNNQATNKVVNRNELIEQYKDGKLLMLNSSFMDQQVKDSDDFSSKSQNRDFIIGTIEPFRSMERYTQLMPGKLLNLENAKSNVNGHRPSQQLVMKGRYVHQEAMTTPQNSDVSIRKVPNKWTAYFFSQSVMTGLCFAVILFLTLTLMILVIYNAIKLQQSKKRLVETITSVTPEPPNASVRIYSIPMNTDNNKTTSFFKSFKSMFGKMMHFKNGKSNLPKSHQDEQESSKNIVTERSSEFFNHKENTSQEKHHEQTQKQSYLDEKKYEGHGSCEKQKPPQSTKQAQHLKSQPDQSENSNFNSKLTKTDFSQTSLKNILGDNAIIDRSVTVQRNLERLRQRAITTGQPQIDNMLITDTWDRSFYTQCRSAETSDIPSPLPLSQDLQESETIDLQEKSQINRILEHLSTTPKIGSRDARTHERVHMRN